MTVKLCMKSMVLSRRHSSPIINISVLTAWLLRPARVQTLLQCFIPSTDSSGPELGTQAHCLSITLANNLRQNITVLTTKTAMQALFVSNHNDNNTQYSVIYCQYSIWLNWQKLAPLFTTFRITDKKKTFN